METLSAQSNLVDYGDLHSGSAPEPDVRARERKSAQSIEMAFFSPESEAFEASIEQPHEIDFRGRPVLAGLYRICARLMMLIGPMLWAALIVLFVWVEFFTT